MVRAAVASSRVARLRVDEYPTPGVVALLHVVHTERTRYRALTEHEARLCEWCR